MKIAKRAAEFIFMNKELVLAKEKEKLVVELTLVNKELTIQITERKLAEDSLRQSYVFSETLLKTIPFGMDIVSESGTVLFQNDNFKEVFGERAIGKKCWDLYRDDKKQCRDCPLIKGITLGETQLHVSNGVLGNRIYEIIHTGMMYQGKKAMLEIFQDITERKHSEDALQESEEKFRTFIDTATDLMIITDKNGQLTDVNKATVNILGYSVDELKKMHIPMLLTEDSRKNEFEPNWGKFIKEGKIEIETTFRTKSGNEIFGELKAVTILDSSGNKSGTRAVFFDLPRRKQAESELIEAKEKAEESDRLKSAFLTNMSHEIRTPMNGILGFTELLKEPNLSSDDQKEFIQTIQISGARMLNTINSIVDISKIESGLID